VPPTAVPPTAVPPTEGPTQSGNTSSILNGVPAAGAAQVTDRGQPLESPCDLQRDMICVEPEEASRGTTFQISVLGQAGQAIQLDFYQQIDCPKSDVGVGGQACYAFVTSVTTAPTNSSGETIYSLQTFGDDIPSVYRVQIAGLNGVWEYFQITE
jgi:hypothetical protein